MIVLTYQEKYDIYAPMIICDHCGETIADVKRGRVLYVPCGWLPLRESHPEVRELFKDNRTEPFFLHDKCIREYDLIHKSPNGEKLHWTPLDSFMSNLCYNIGGIKAVESRRDIFVSGGELL